MKTKLIHKPLPALMDCAIAIAISSMPGIAELDGQTKALYQSIAKQLLISEIKAKGKFAKQKINLLTKPIYTSSKS